MNPYRYIKNLIGSSEKEKSSLYQAIKDGMSPAIQYKKAFDRDPALPFLEDKLHSKLIAKSRHVPIVPLLFDTDSPKLFRRYVRRYADKFGDFVVKTNHGCGDVCIVRRQDGVWTASNKDLN